MNDSRTYEMTDYVNTSGGSRTLSTDTGGPAAADMGVAPALLTLRSCAPSVNSSGSATHSEFPLHPRLMPGSMRLCLSSKKLETLDRWNIDDTRARRT